MVPSGSPQKETPGDDRKDEQSIEHKGNRLDEKNDPRKRDNSWASSDYSECSQNSSVDSSPMKLGSNVLELELLVKNCGYTAMADLVSATRNGSLECGLDQIGTLEEGKIADSATSNKPAGRYFLAAGSRERRIGSERRQGRPLDRKSVV